VLHSPCPLEARTLIWLKTADGTLERQPSLATHVCGFSNGGLEHDALEMLVEIKKAVATCTLSKSVAPINYTNYLIIRKANKES